MALALFKDPRDPRNFSQKSIDDPRIREVCRNVEIKELPAANKFEYALGSRLTVTLKDGRILKHDAPSFKGLPIDPLDRDSLWEKFSKLCYKLGEKEAERVFEQLCNLGDIDDISTLDVTGKV